MSATTAPIRRKSRTTWARSHSALRRSAADGVPAARSVPVRDAMAPRALDVVPLAPERRGAVVGRSWAAGSGRAGWVARRVAVRERERCFRAIGGTRIGESLMFRAE